jgi:hypothetical protein
MKNKDFKDLLTSIDQARKIHASRMKPGRIIELKIKTPIYYAHSKMIYNTSREKSELKYLKRFGKVICPNNHIGEQANINYYLDIIKSKCKTVVCSEYKRYIGKGVFEEISHADYHGIPNYVLRKQSKRYRLSIIKGVDIVDENDWKIKFAKIII